MVNAWERERIATGRERYTVPTVAIVREDGRVAWQGVAIASHVNHDGSRTGITTVQVTDPGMTPHRRGTLIDVGTRTLVDLTAVGPDARMMAHGTVYTAREGVNVILPGTGIRGEGNHHYGPARGRVVDAVRRAVRQTVDNEARIGWEHDGRVARAFMTPPREVTPGPDGRGVGSWALRPYTVVVREVCTGEYAFTVWQNED